MQRDLYWDSLKFVLIFLVVYGHTMERYAFDGGFNCAMYSFIYLFHMPLFVFVSGRFSHVRDRGKYRQGIVRLLETYLVFQALRTVVPAAVHGRLSLEAMVHWIVVPGWTMWYLFSLIFWRMLVLCLPEQMLRRSPRRVLAACFAIGILGGFVPVGAQFSLQRTMVFLPFFFLGYYSVGVDVKRHVARIPLVLAAAVPVVVFLLLYWTVNAPPTSVLYGNASYYSPQTVSPLLRCVARCLWFAAALGMSAVVMRFIPTAERLSVWGRVTLFVYLYHTFALTVPGVLIARGYLPLSAGWLWLYAVVITFGMVYLSRFKPLCILLNPVSYFLKKE